ncbi:MAG: VPLPA-CTERM sorting domain-containing protein [Gammaproteobacteria bacterium]|nr:VPLPA-CTERM sorting domain-containing protein [Gammaproteobacteria bacterium]
MISCKKLINGALFVVAGMFAIFSIANAATIESTTYEGDGGLQSTSSGYLINLTAFNVNDSGTNTGISEIFTLNINTSGISTLTIGSLLSADVNNFVLTSDHFGGGEFSANLDYTGGSMMGSFTTGTLIGDYTASNQVLASVYEVQAVPVPAAVWLFGSGLIGLAGIARRKAG